MEKLSAYCEKVKCILHMLYDMVESKSVTNGHAMSICGKIVHYAPLFASSKWWKKPVTDLPDQNASKKIMLTLSSATKMCLSYWIMMFNRLRLGNLPIRPGNNGVSRYPSYQKSFGLTENFDWTYRYDNTIMLCPMVFLRKSFHFSVKMSYSTTRQKLFSTLSFIIHVVHRKFIIITSWSLYVLLFSCKITSHRKILFCKMTDMFQYDRIFLLCSCKVTISRKFSASQSDFFL